MDISVASTTTWSLAWYCGHLIIILPLIVMSPSVTPILDVLGELYLNLISDLQWKDISLISIIFGESLRPFLPSASASLLLCLSSKNLSCETYQHILGELSHPSDHMRENHSENVLKFFIQPFLSRNPSCSTTTHSPLSTMTPTTPSPTKSTLPAIPPTLIESPVSLPVQCPTTQVNASRICEGVNSTALQLYLANGQVPCNFTLEHYACAELSGFFAEQLAQLLLCDLSSNMSHSREIWKLLFTKTSVGYGYLSSLYYYMVPSLPLIVMSPSVTPILDVLGELYLNLISDLQWKDISLISIIFGESLRPFLPSASASLLLCLSSKNLSCETYQHILGELSHPSDHMRENHSENVLKFFIQPFLSRNPSCSTTTHSPLSTMTPTTPSPTKSTLPAIPPTLIESPVSLPVQCPTTQVNASRICEGVNSTALQLYLANGQVPCNFTLEHYACAELSGFFAEQLAQLLLCDLSSNMSHSREIWKLLFTKTSVGYGYLSSLYYYIVPSLPLIVMSPSVTPILDVLGELYLNLISDLQWKDISLISIIFGESLRPFLPSASASLLQCVSSKNLTCESYQHILSELSYEFDQLGEHQAERVLRFFIMPFLFRNSTDSGCISNNSTAWLIDNFGPFTVLIQLKSLFDLNKHFDPLAVLDLLSPKQKAELMVLPLPHPQGKGEVVTRVLDHLLKSPVERNLPEVLNQTVLLAKQNEAPCEFFQAMLDGSLTSAPGTQESIIRGAMEQLLLLSPNDCLVSKCLRTPINESQICDGVNSTALQSNLVAGLGLCNINLEHYACAQLTGFTEIHLAQLLVCELSSNITYSRETWKLLLTKTIAILDGALILFSNIVSSSSLTVMGSSVTHVLDVLGELRLDSISDLQWKDISFISLLFGESLRPFLPSASAGLLLCVSSKNLSCETYQHILGELSHPSDYMRENHSENVLKFFIQPFLSRNPSCPTEVYTYEIDLVMRTVDADQLKMELSEFDLPLPLATTEQIDITNINVTTVCYSNTSGYRCVCEEQYTWPHDSCITYGACDEFSEGTCGCLNGLPTNGPFCQRDVNECDFDPCGLNSTCANTIGSYNCSCWRGYTPRKTSLPIDTNNPCIDINECDFDQCGPNSNCSNIIGSYNCSCWRGYTPTSSSMPISSSNPCIGSTTTRSPLSTMTPGTNNIVTATTAPSTLSTPSKPKSTPPAIPPIPPLTLPTQQSTLHTSLPPPPPQSTEQAPPPGTFSTINLSLTIQSNYDFRFNDPTSQIYNRYKTDIENAVEDNSDKLPGYKVNSANVRGFRSGSIIADFSFQLSNPRISFLDASIGIINNLKAKNYEFPDNPFAQSERRSLSGSTGSLFPGEQMVLNCNGTITEWRFNGQTLSGASGEIFSITNVNPADNGRYECVSTKNSVPFIRWETIDRIKPFPIIQTSQDKGFQCEVGQKVTLQCCSSPDYGVEMVKVADVDSYLQDQASVEDCTYSYIIQNCGSNSGNVVFNCKLKNANLQSFDYSSRSITITFENKEFDCSNESFGAGNVSQVAEGNCKDDEVGSVTAECQGTDWKIIEDNCVLFVIKELEEESEFLTAETLPEFVNRLSRVTAENKERITNSTANIESIVNTLSNVGNVSRALTISGEIIQDFLNTSSVIVSNSTINAWSRINNGNATGNVSASFLGSVEDISGSLEGDTSFETGTEIIQLRQTLVNSSFSETLGADSSAAIFIPEEGNFTITTITFSTLNNVLPARNSSDNDSSLSNSINGAVVLVQVNDTINNISLSFDLINETLGDPQCVFWNFELFDGFGGWDSFGCELISFENNTVTCECNHTTSFSILMSPSIPPGIRLLLDFITYIGVGISLASLIICLIIEGVVWKSMTRNDTAYMRHVSVVNVAVSLLIADIWFIIGAAIADSESTAVGPCTAATFFIHFFYLALFFWMLVSALLLFYRTVMVFSQMKRSTMLAIAFSLGYGAPLIIAVVTVAATAGGGGYIRENQICWLNWNETKALLAFVIPALTIVAINLLVMIVVLYKMLIRGVGNTKQIDEKNALEVIARCVIILTPLFGLTWGFGIGLMIAPEAVGLHVVFAVLNSLQGFFILVFGTLLDSKIKSALVEIQRSTSGGTRSTNVGTSSSSTLDFFRRIKRRNVYNVSGAPVSSGSATLSHT
ncbi:uncharacterized protein LOC143109816 isoform X2 [Alosa pseudoharengus]|uniref:uncharacterized protein LOC143109816 isoform X2 n=1 Tax=Alosa pseudoharengus TaxID=34774 RepID=UPI003F8C8A5E